MPNTDNHDDNMDGKARPPNDNDEGRRPPPGGPHSGPPRRGTPPPERPPPPAPEHWHYVPGMGVIAHLADQCNICDVYLKHVMGAFMTGEKPFKNAQFSSRFEWYSAEWALEGARRAADRLQRRVDELSEELLRERARSSAATYTRVEPYANSRPRGGGNTRHRVDQMRGEKAAVAAFDRLSVISDDVISQPVSESTESTTESTNNAAATALQRIRNNPYEQLNLNEYEMADVEALAARQEILASEFGIRWIRAVTDGRTVADVSGTLYTPTSEEQLQFLNDTMEQRKSLLLVLYLGQFRSKAQATGKGKRSPAQSAICRRWVKPEWAPSTVYNPITQKMESGVSEKARTRPHVLPLLRGE